MRDRGRRAGQQLRFFETSLGVCGVAWSEAGITRLQLPERDEGATAERLSHSTGGAGEGQPTAEVAAAIALLQRYFRGEPVDLGGIALDLERASHFHRSVYAATRAIGWGRTSSYGTLAAEVGSPGAARAIGQAMARNPVPVIVPCHRVLASGGRPGGFSAFGGLVTKERLLELEGVTLAPEPPLLALMGRR